MGGGDEWMGGVVPIARQWAGGLPFPKIRQVRSKDRKERGF